jgi:hypothetical protein
VATLAAADLLALLERDFGSAVRANVLHRRTTRVQWLLSAGAGAERAAGLKGLAGGGDVGFVGRHDG